MAMSHVQDSTSSTNVTSPVTLNLTTSTPTIGDFVVVTFGIGNPTAPTVTTTTGTSSAWTIKHATDGSNQYAALAYATISTIAGSSPWFGAQVTFTSGTSNQCTLSEFTGVGAFDQQTTNTGSGGSTSAAPCTSLTPNSQGAGLNYLYIAQCASSGATTVSATAPSGFTLIGGGGNDGLAAYLITTSTSAQAPSFTLSTPFPNAWATLLTDFFSPTSSTTIATQPLVVSRQALASAF